MTNEHAIVPLHVKVGSQKPSLLAVQ